MREILLILLFSFLLSDTSAQALNSPRLDSLIELYSQEHSIVGLSIGVVHNKQSYTKSHGTTSHNKQIPVSDSTLFNIASISKLFTTIAIMQLVENGELTLEEKLVDILPGFTMKDKRHRDISIKQLLTHSSGLMWDNKLDHSPDDRTSLPLYINHLRNKKLKFKPGTKMSYKTYSNVAFDLLGLVIEQKTNLPFDRYIKEQILSKVGMDNSTYFFEQIDSNRLALPQIVAGNSKAIKRLNFSGVDRKKNPILDQQPLRLANHITVGEEYEHNPSGNLISSTRELNAFSREILAIYHQESTADVLRKKSLTAMWDASHKTDNERISMGLGWWIQTDPDLGPSYFHVGTNPGCCSILMIYPKHDLAITILANGWYAKDIIWNDLFKELVHLHTSK